MTTVYNTEPNVDESAKSATATTATTATMPTTSDTSATNESTERTPRRRRFSIPLGGPVVGLIVLILALWSRSPYFMTERNISNVLSQISDIGIMAAGAFLVILIGGIDLSVVAVMALTMMVNGYLFSKQGWPFPLALLAGIAVGAFIGLVNGLLVTYGKVQAFVATLATMSACQGLALLITNGNTINGFPSWFGKLSDFDVFHVPLQAILLATVFLVLAFWLRYRPNGRALYAIGGNDEVARLSGLSVKRLKTLTFIIASSLGVVAGAINISTLDSAQPTAGSGYLLNIIAIVVIGGASLAGGTGSMGGTFVGLLIVGILNNGMSLLHVNPNLQPVVIGAVILAAVLSDRDWFAQLRNGPLGRLAGKERKQES